MKQWTALAMVLALGIAPGYASTPIAQYNIPAQSLNDALMRFAAESKLALIFSADLIRGIQAEALHGTMSTEQALNRLLNNSGFAYRFIDDNTVTLVRREMLDAAPETVTATLDTVTVVDQKPQAVKHRDSQVVDEDPQSYRASNAISATRTDTPVKQIPQ